MANHNWADVTEEGELMIEWDEVRFNAYQFDNGQRDYYSALGKLVSLVERTAFEQGFKQGLEARGTRSAMLCETAGTA